MEAWGTSENAVEMRGRDAHATKKGTKKGGLGASARLDLLTQSVKHNAVIRGATTPRDEGSVRAATVLGKYAPKIRRGIQILLAFGLDRCAGRSKIWN